MTQQIKFPLSLLPPIFYFLCTQLAVHIAYTLLVFIVTRHLALLFALSIEKKIIAGIIVWSLGTLGILLANFYYIPNSKFSLLVSTFFSSKHLVEVFLTIDIVILALCCSLAAIEIIWRYRLILIVSITLLLINFASLKPAAFLGNQGGEDSRPNIFLIGVDSLRPDFIGDLGGDLATPFFDNFIQHAVTFSNAVTPLARTFPSWVGILTSQYPREVGIRTNLDDQSQADFSQTLPAILHRNGYETVFATDETRFSNIDKNFGFDRIITPPMGLNDFLLGTFNDFPISNLLVNTFIGRWLFPYSYGNRPVYFTYDPDSFLNLLSSELPKKQSKPLFFVVHFCLPHYPYLWANLAENKFTVRERYQQSILRVDQQLNKFFHMLDDYHLLNNAIVVLLSDHGEALELPGDRLTEKDAFISKQKDIPQFYPGKLDNEAINVSSGHGGDVLGLTQYHSLLAFRLYGKLQTSSKIVSGVVSLLDIKPTLLEFLKIKHYQTSGRSLLAYWQQDTIIKPQHIFLESDFTPDSIRTIYPNIQQALIDGIAFFQVDQKTQRLVVRDSMAAMILKSKQYADIFGEWILALYPQVNRMYVPILVNLENGAWTNDLSSPFAKNSPAASMLIALRVFYGNEIGTVL